METAIFSSQDAIGFASMVDTALGRICAIAPKGIMDSDAVMVSHIYMHICVSVCDIACILCIM